MVEQVFFALGYQLRGEQTGEQLDGNGVLYHAEQLAVEEEQLLDISHTVESVAQLFIFIVKEIGERGEQSILSAEIVVK